MKTIIAATALAASMGAPAFSQASCLETAKAYFVLVETYGEIRVSLALSANGYVSEVWANPETGTWTILGTSPAGMSCVQDQGEGYEAVEPLPSGDPA